MANPDNVARLIAAGSALATAANMSVSYATYRKKRPRLVVTSKITYREHKTMESKGGG
ncbi:hypothetical protein [Streptomyces sp. NPDC059631]|uniref:hypothetical protein n=1 Tax=unclassified Streptomyces TaxID=2593676 RepID=UPI0036BCEC27